MPTEKSYQAYARDGTALIGKTPREAATRFFETYPNKRKCSIAEGVQDGSFFVVTYAINRNRERPYSAHGVTKQTLIGLPDVA